jgi:hypothetical protein
MKSILFKAAITLAIMYGAGTLNAADEIQGFSHKSSNVVINATRDFVGGRIEVYN